MTRLAKGAKTRVDERVGAYNALLERAAVSMVHTVADVFAGGRAERVAPSLRGYQPVVLLLNIFFESICV